MNMSEIISNIHTCKCRYTLTYIVIIFHMSLSLTIDEENDGSLFVDNIYNFMTKQVLHQIR